MYDICHPVVSNYSTKYLYKILGIFSKICVIFSSTCVNSIKTRIFYTLAYEI